jgi:hypothetical protein
MEKKNLSQCDTDRRLRQLPWAHFGRHRIGNALYHHIGILRANAFGNGLGHDFDVAIY